MHSHHTPRDDQGRTALECLAYYRERDMVKVQKTAAVIAATPTDELIGSRAWWAGHAGSMADVTSALALVALMDEAIIAREA